MSFLLHIMEKKFTIRQDKNRDSNACVIMCTRVKQEDELCRIE